MSYPLVPPPANDTGAFTVPRYLQRWLDINPISPLSRAGTFLILPAFTTTKSWLGVSDIVAAFNFEAPNNFSLKLIVAPSGVNYTLCIAYRVGNIVTRYVVWSASGQVINLAIPAYTGQVILKNCRFEIWNTSQGNATQSTDIDFTTSVLQAEDYRYASDSVLKANDGQVSVFTDSNGFNPQSVPSTNILTGQYIASAINPNAGTGQFFDTNSTNEFLSFTPWGASATDSVINNYYYFPVSSNQGGPSFTYSPTTTAYGVFAVIQLTGTSPAVGAQVFGFGSSALSASDLKVLTNGYSPFTYNGATLGGTANPVTGQWYILFLWYNVQVQDTGGYLLPVSSYATEPTLTLHSMTGQPAMSVFGLGEPLMAPTNTQPMKVAEILIYQPTTLNPFTSPVRQAILNYLGSKYNQAAFALPLTFPSNSVSTTN